MTEHAQKFYIETYGCQMNIADSELVVSILKKHGFEHTTDYKESDIIFMNTCSVRDNAEQRVFGRLNEFKFLKKSNPGLKIGIIGCMAERMKEELLEKEKLVDLIAGPDSYRDLPNLLKTTESGQRAVNVILLQEETYADISPVRLDKNNISAFVSIMRGCDHKCAYCVVPYTRGKERSRSLDTIAKEVQELIAMGYKEVTLIGQNVDKYNYKDVNFARLLDTVAQMDNKMRVRFSTSFPHDMTDEVLHTMAKHHNICKNIHLPVQSGSTRMLEMMKRGYTREWYMDRINAIRSIVPDCAISTDVIAGFCTETEQDHQDTLSLMEWAQFDFAYMFKYSVRPGTFAADNYADDVPEAVKAKRLTEIINLQNRLSLESNKRDLGKTVEVLVEGVSKRSDDRLFGRNSQNKVVVFPRDQVKIGDLVNIIIGSYTSATLTGYPVV